MNRSNAMPQDTQDQLEPRTEPIARVGRIVAVTGAHAIILLDAEERINIDAERSPEIGTLLKVDCATSISLALVSALSSPMPSHNKGEQELRIVEVEFIGELPKDENGRTKSSAAAFPPTHPLAIPSTAPAAANCRRPMPAIPKPPFVWATSSRTPPFQP
jgi:hypothetical protein